jgi:hypothetical protein
VRDLLGRHDVKQAAALVMHLLEFGKPGVAARVEGMAGLSERLAQIGEQVGETNRAKQRGLYVDLVDGEIKRPEEISEADARAALERAREIAGSAGPLHDPDSLAVLANPPPEVLRFAGVTFERYLESMDVGGPEAAAAVAVEMARIVREGDSPDSSASSV